MSLAGRLKNKKKNKTELDLSDEDLNGTIPSSIADFSNVSHLYLNGNELIGTIPSEIARLTNISHLYLQHNQLSGSIPAELGLLSNLTILLLAHNKFSGTIPQSLGHLSKLEVLSLGNNHLSGEIPDTIGSNTTLKNLNLQNNYFDKIPISITGRTDWISCELENSCRDLEILNTISNATVIDEKVFDNLQKIRENYRKQIEMERNRANTLLSLLSLKHSLSVQKIKATDFYDFDYRVNSGANGLVMTCYITNNGIPYKVALKMLLNFGMDKEVLQDKVAREFEMLTPQLCAHPNIIHMICSFRAIPTDDMIAHLDDRREFCVDENGENRETLFFVLEHIPIALNDIVDTLSPKLIIRFALQLSRGLECLYNNKIAHLDIIDRNLLISELDDLIIADFGEAQKLNDVWETLPGEIGGNSFHMSPEVRRARNSGLPLPCEKQYSWELGMLIFQMSSGGLYPFGDEGVPDPFDDSRIVFDVTECPQEYHSLLKSLLCPSNIRISITEATQQLEQIANEFYHLEEQQLFSGLVSSDEFDIYIA